MPVGLILKFCVKLTYNSQESEFKCILVFQGFYPPKLHSCLQSHKHFSACFFLSAVSQRLVPVFKASRAGCSRPTESHECWQWGYDGHLVLKRTIPTHLTAIGSVTGMAVPPAHSDTEHWWPLSKHCLTTSPKSA